MTGRTSESVTPFFFFCRYVSFVQPPTSPLAHSRRYKTLHIFNSYSTVQGLRTLRFVQQHRLRGRHIANLQEMKGVLSMQQQFCLYGQRLADLRPVRRLERNPEHKEDAILFGDGIDPEEGLWIKPLPG